MSQDMITDAEIRTEIKHMAKLLSETATNIKLLTEVSVKLQTILAVHEEKHLNVENKLISGSTAFSELRAQLHDIDRDSRKDIKEVNARIDRMEGFINKLIGAAILLDVLAVVFLKFWN